VSPVFASATDNWIGLGIAVVLLVLLIYVLVAPERF
jgi:hypothetical protein